MSRLLLIAALFSLVTFSCKKEKDDLDNAEVIGNWELSVTSAMSGLQNYPPGNGNILKLRSDGSFEQIIPGQPTRQGYYKYKSKQDCSPQYSSNKVLILYHDGYDDIHYVKTEAGKLLLNTSNCLADGGSFTYLRQ